MCRLACKRVSQKQPESKHPTGASIIHEGVPSCGFLSSRAREFSEPQGSQLDPGARFRLDLIFPSPGTPCPGHVSCGSLLDCKCIIVVVTIIVTILIFIIIVVIMYYDYDYILLLLLVVCSYMIVIVVCHHCCCHVAVQLQPFASKVLLLPHIWPGIVPAVNGVCTSVTWCPKKLKKVPF